MPLQALSRAAHPHQGPATDEAVAMSLLVSSFRPATLPASSACLYVRISCSRCACLSC